MAKHQQLIMTVEGTSCTTTPNWHDYRTISELSSHLWTYIKDTSTTHNEETWTTVLTPADDYTEVKQAAITDWKHVFQWGFPHGVDDGQFRWHLRPYTVPATVVVTFLTNLTKDVRNLSQLLVLGGQCFNLLTDGSSLRQTVGPVPLQYSCFARDVGGVNVATIHAEATALGKGEVTVQLVTDTPDVQVPPPAPNVKVQRRREKCSKRSQRTRPYNLRSRRVYAYDM